MRNGLLMALGAGLAIAPFVAAGPMGHDGHDMHLMLYGTVEDTVARTGVLSPYKPDFEWQSPGLCDLQSGALPAPLSDCQRITYSLVDAARRDLPLDPDPVQVKFWLSADYLLLPGAVPVIGIGLPEYDAGANPMTTVEATLKVDGKEWGKKAQTKDVVTGLDGKPTGFDFAFTPEAKIPAGKPVDLTIRWWEVDAAGTRTGSTRWNVHEGGDYSTTMMLPAAVPLLNYTLVQDRINLQRLCEKTETYEPAAVNGKLFRKACKEYETVADAVAIQILVDSAFQNPAVGVGNLTVNLDGPAKPTHVSKPYEMVDHGTVYWGVVWDYAADAADPDVYTAKAAYKGEEIGTLALEPALGLEGKSLPAPGAWALAALVGLMGAVLVRRRR